MNKLKQLLLKAKWGKLSNKDMKYIMQETFKVKEAELYTLIHIIGKAEMYEHEEYIASFLCYKKNSSVTALALTVLCKYWQFSNKYVEYVIKFLNGVSWDENDNIKLVAINITGNYLIQNDNSILLSNLNNIFNDESEYNVIRSAAYIAIGVSFGYGYKDLPPVTKFMNFSKDIDPELIKKLNKKLAIKLK